MKNITNTTNTNDLPSIKDFSNAKLKEGLSFLGSKVSDGKKKLKLQKELLTINSKINSLSKNIGIEVITRIGNDEPIFISEDYINQTKLLLKEKAELMEVIKNG